MSLKGKPELKESGFALVVRNDMTKKEFTSIMLSLSGQLLKVLKDGTTITLGSLPPDLIFNHYAWVAISKKPKKKTD